MLQEPPLSPSQMAAVMKKVQTIIRRCMVSIGSTLGCTPSQHDIQATFSVQPSRRRPREHVPDREGLMELKRVFRDILAFLQIELKSREHKVTTYNPREGIYMVKSPIQVSGTGNNVYTLWLNNKFCSCGKWQTYTLPCSHVLAVCRENGSRTDAYVPEIYSRQTYRKTYQANFHPILNEKFWRDVPFNLIFYPPNMKNERG
ncbi:hypothetical protein M9H77_27737 [Catharanthus roseus]|uniref:Uncharacterized protein n=1 Tax=Catharanthus roseus TaxID=4058 RepID=A0ACC0ADR7_CATRO|nr:hypothetical protein M9H77_27737 [Catharanthus roseus]